MKSITKRNCLICNNEFLAKTTKWHIKLGRSKYCSRKCSGLATRQRIILECQVCKKKVELAQYRQIRFKYCSQKNLQADHIKPFALFPELRLELSNGRTLCVECHKSTPTWGRKALNSGGGGLYV